MSEQFIDKAKKDGYDLLSAEGKKLVEMYLTARQFKNAILEEEIIVFPSEPAKEGTLICDSIKVTFRGNQLLVRVFPFVVSKAFACEVYLKLLLTHQGFDLKTLKRTDGHGIGTLYDKTNDEFKADFYAYFSSRYGNKATVDFLEKEIKLISDVFVKWRYIYEHIEEANSVNYGFLSAFCDYLNNACQKMILENYNYDVSKNMR